MSVSPLHRLPHTQRYPPSVLTHSSFGAQLALLLAHSSISVKKVNRCNTFYRWQTKHRVHSILFNLPIHFPIAGLNAYPKSQDIGGAYHGTRGRGGRGASVLVVVTENEPQVKNAGKTAKKRRQKNNKKT